MMTIRKQYLITGTSGSIGGAVAIELDKRGDKLVLISRSYESGIEFINTKLVGKDHSIIVMDLEKVESFSDLLTKALETIGKFDGFIHAAGNGDVRPLKMTTPGFMMKVMNINFISFIEIIRIINSPKYRNDELRIVGVSATGAFQGNSTKTAYCASKAAMNSAVRCLAKELSNKGVRINTVAPGATYSKMMDEILNLPGGEEALKKIIERQFLGVCTPKDIADGILFLLSDEAKMISGTCLPIDGGKLIN
jgi:NAD(P)-dependent dehydrogenase (short-subunit alcohol dehydrogenase family)